jgi:predicted metalloprotease
MQDKLGASGDFAWAYVIAHEMGHHVQKLAGIADQVARETRDNPDQRNALSVRQELQADCYAGVWANSVFRQGQLEQGDVQEAMAASEAVGDDRLQRQATGSVNPDTFTHGTSEQRERWFESGYRSGDPGSCDTFSADSL